SVRPRANSRSLAAASRRSTAGGGPGKNRALAGTTCLPGMGVDHPQQRQTNVQPSPRHKPARLPMLALAAAIVAYCGTGDVQAANAAGKRTAHLATGIDMAYLELGEREGEAVVFLHGYTDSALSF